jgi:hypothetical protein
MIRARYAVAATIVGVSVAGATVFTQQPQPTAPPMTSVLAGRKFSPPIRGEATIDIVKTPTKREGTTLVTKIVVKNTSAAPIPRLKVAETWFDKDGGMIPGGEAVINGLLQPNVVQTLEIRTPVNLKMAQSQLQFSHANGTIKPKSVKSLDAPKEPATKNASATKPAAKAPPKSAKKKK